MIIFSNSFVFQYPSLTSGYVLYHDKTSSHMMCQHKFYEDVAGKNSNTFQRNKGYKYYLPQFKPLIKCYIPMIKLKALKILSATFSIFRTTSKTLF